MNTVLFFLLIIATAVIAGLIFLPRTGIMPRFRSIKKQNERILVEDALKYLFTCEENTEICNLEILRGHLNISKDETDILITRLAELKLIDTKEGALDLTNSGRSYALKIIRVHRLWELYLANHTSIKETDWHRIAEDKEHETNEEDARLLAAKLGNPLRDPHGDPIPSEHGELRKHQGINLVNIDVNSFAEIVHIEDEPKEIYAEILNENLYPGSQIKILDMQGDEIFYEMNGEKKSISFLLAKNITVVLLSEDEFNAETYEPLSSIKLGEEAMVVGISHAMRGQQRRRLLDFGIVPGTKIRAQLQSLGGDPTAYEIRGTTIALRKNQSDYIYIRKN